MELPFWLSRFQECGPAVYLWCTRGVPVVYPWSTFPSGCLPRCAEDVLDLGFLPATLSGVPWKQHLEAAAPGSSTWQQHLQHGYAVFCAQTHLQVPGTQHTNTGFFE